MTFIDQEEERILRRRNQFADKKSRLNNKFMETASVQVNQIGKTRHHEARKSTESNTVKDPETIYQSDTKDRYMYVNSFELHTKLLCSVVFLCLTYTRLFKEMALIHTFYYKFVIF